ncbi:MAG TPA: DMT family transporter [Candidatus Elarobacter sp.]|nr:DMT family transporter [Candidatus Elarobacter sp.]
MPSSWSVVVLAALGTFAGANLAFQAVVNTQLRGFLVNPLRASFVSYIGGTLCCVILLLATRQSLNVVDPGMRSNWLLWTGGLYGLVYLIIVVWLIPKLGSATVLALVVAGQMLASLAFDHTGLFGIVPRSIDVPKVIGAAFLVAGVVLIRR